MEFRGAYRARANVVACYGVTLDVDDGSPWGPIAEALDGLHYLAHSTWSSTPDAPRWRVVLPLDRAVHADAYERVWRWLAIALDEVGVVADPQGVTPVQPYAVPGRPPSGSYEYHEGDGALLDVAEALVAVPAPEPPPAYKPRGDLPYDRRVERARRYVERMPPGIQGSHGSAATFLAAQVLVRGFTLEPDDALALLVEFNERCLPPWSVRELQHKIRQAVKRGTMAYGKMTER